MAGWQAKKLQLPNHNFETTAIKFEDGRVGLCYHGKTIWQHEGAGWEDFIDADWNKVWKAGKPCAFKDLPPDMRIACPVCGATIHPEDKECSQCGIIFEKMKVEPAEEQTTAPYEDSGKKRRSKMVDFSLALVILIIAGFFVYRAFKPEAPQSSPGQTEGTMEQPIVNRNEPPPRQPDVYQTSPAESQEDTADYQDNASSDTVDSFAESGGDAEAADYYSYINLDDPETAHRQLMEATKQLNDEAATVQKELLTASTPEEKKRAQKNKIRYDQKALQLSRLIKAFNAENEKTP